MIFFFTSLVGFDDANQSLTLARLTHGHHQTTADFELRDQWLRHRWTTCGNQNGIVGRVCRPAERAVETLYRSVVNSQFPDPPLRFAREVPDSFNGVNLRR